MDIHFLHATWDSILGFIYQNILTLIGCILALILGDIAILIEEISSIPQGIVSFASVSSMIAVGIFIWSLFYRPNFYNLAITPISSFKQLDEFGDEAYHQSKNDTKFLLPGIIIFIAVILFLYSFLLNGDFQESVHNSIIFTTPFHIGVLAFHTTTIVLETGLLLLRHILQEA